MPKNRKNPRDASKLSGKPLADTLEPSPILSPEWTTSRDLVEHNLPFSPEVIKDLTVFLLENININATHLFRADILYDSWGTLRTPEQKAQSFAQAAQNPHLEEPAAVASPVDNDLSESSHADERVDPLPASDVPGFKLTRTVVRNLIPRNPKIDRPLAQTCHFYEATAERDRTDPSTGSTHRFLIVYIPHLTRKEEVPFYHPLLRALATLYDFTDAPPSPPSDEDRKGSGTLSLHFLLFPNEPIPTRLERTLHALLSTQIRLARGTRLADKPPGATSGNTNPIKDNVIPQHLVQNTYLRIKLKYAPALCRDWVEDTEPSKHVFEDLAIAAFLIELWRSMYGAVPSDERGSTQGDSGGGGGDDGGDSFPGFVDVACGNGLLVYVLLQEGYPGWGFDARQRKTWGIFPEDVRARLREEIYIPRPFSDALAPAGHPDGVVNGETEEGDKFDVGVPTHTGSFPADTFIISNHADELTIWTPLMAALANPVSPLPFLAIPCCSHALSGARHRYPPPKSGNKHKNTPRSHDNKDEKEEDEEDEQPVSGDLAALRQKKQQATDPSNAGFDSSMYGSLTAKTVAVATEVGYDVERTLLRIPSTRNMGVLGGRVRTTREWWGRKGLNSINGGGDAVGHGHGGKGKGEGEEADDNAEKVLQNATHLVQKECRTEGGVEAAARIWVDRARGLHRGQGRGKQPRH